MKSEFEKFASHEVVVDTKTPIVYIGTLAATEENFLVLEEVDVHDINDTQTTKELYVLEARKFGIKKNRSRVHLCVDQVVSISRLDDVIQY